MTRFDETNRHQHTIKAAKPSKHQKAVMSLLGDQHQYIGGIRKTLAQETAKLKRRGEPDYTILRDIMSYLTEYPDVHHHPLEDRLFDIMLQKEEAPRSEIFELMREHDDLASESQYLLRYLEDVVAGTQQPKKNQLYLDLSHFNQFYASHVKREESGIFTAAESLLSSAEWKALAATISPHSDPLIQHTGSADTRFTALRERINHGVDEAVQRIVFFELIGLYSAVESSTALSRGMRELMDEQTDRLTNIRNLVLGSEDEPQSSIGKELGHGFDQSVKIVKTTTKACIRPHHERRKLMKLWRDSSA